MDLSYTMVSGCLNLEIALALLLCLPWISCKRWHGIFNSSTIALIAAHVKWIFMCILFGLVVLCADSIWEMYVYTGQDELVDIRAQRNFCITGISLFLLLNLRTMLTCVSQVAILEANDEAIQKQAENAGAVNKTLLDENSALKKLTAEKEVLLEDIRKVEELKDQVKAAERKAEQSKAHAAAMRRQSKNLTMAYDRLVADHQKLRNSVMPGDKKDD